MKCIGEFSGRLLSNISVMAGSWTRKAPSYVVLGSSIAALVCFAIGVSSKWSAGDIKLPSAMGGVAGMAGESEWDLVEFTLGDGAGTFKWESVFKFYDEGTFACDALFTSEGGIVGSTASTQVSTSIDSCTSSRSDFDRVDTVMRLSYLALAIAAFGALTGLSVIALAAQDNGADLWLPGLYTAVSTVLSFCLALSAVAMYSTTLTAATETDQADWLVLAHIAAASGNGVTTLEGSEFTNGTLEQSTKGGFVAAVIAVVFMAFASIASVYDLFVIRKEAQEAEEQKEAEAAAEEQKKAELLAKNRAAAEAQEKRVAELQGETAAGAAAENKMDQ